MYKNDCLCIHVHVYTYLHILFVYLSKEFVYTSIIHKQQKLFHAWSSLCPCQYYLLVCKYLHIGLNGAINTHTYISIWDAQRKRMEREMEKIWRGRVDISIFSSSASAQGPSSSIVPTMFCFDTLLTVFTPCCQTYTYHRTQLHTPCVQTNSLGQQLLHEQWNTEAAARGRNSLGTHLATQYMVSICCCGIFYPNYTTIHYCIHTL